MTTGEHPCPAGDGCALNRGASHCFHCRRNWPPDETWAVPLEERPDLRRPGGVVSVRVDPLARAIPELRRT